MPKKQPPTLHIGGTQQPYLCDAERIESWPEKYLDDAVARTLEVCESCLEIYESNRGTESKERLLARLSETPATDTESVSEPDSSPIPSPTPKVVVEAMTLRQYLES